MSSAQNEIQNGIQNAGPDGTAAEDSAPNLSGFFFFAGIAGFLTIFYGEEMESSLAYFAPPVIVLVYALVVGALTKSCRDQALAEHHIDSIYFLGFLVTLFSLVTLFYRLQNGAVQTETDGTVQLARTLTYIGISVSTSLAGVFFRSFFRGNYLRAHPEQSVDTIDSFLAERAGTVDALNRREKEYVGALKKYVRATESFSTGLTESQQRLTPQILELARVLSDQNTQLRDLAQTSALFGETVHSIRKHAADVPWSGVTGEMERFQQGVRELNEVLDALIIVLENKVERL